MVITKSVVEQLVDIYYEKEWWSTPKMSYEEAIKYHQKGLDSGIIWAYVEDGEVLGYYQRIFVGTDCFLMNVVALTRQAFKEMKKHFFNTMPSHITHITGEKQRVGGAWQKVSIRRKHGNG